MSQDPSPTPREPVAPASITGPDGTVYQAVPSFQGTPAGGQGVAGERHVSAVAGSGRSFSKTQALWVILLATGMGVGFIVLRSHPIRIDPNAASLADRLKVGITTRYEAPPAPAQATPASFNVVGLKPAPPPAPTQASNVPSFMPVIGNKEPPDPLLKARHAGLFAYAGGTGIGGAQAGGPEGERGPVTPGAIAPNELAAKLQATPISSVTANVLRHQPYLLTEGTVIGWLGANCPREWPVELVMEGVDERTPLTFPRQTPVGKTRLKLIIDPIDGTRSLMYDKRPGWALAGLAPQFGRETNLTHIRVAAMTELPVTKQWAADPISAVRGAGLVAERVNVQRTTERQRINVRPSAATDFRHGFASLVKFFPEGKALTGQIEEAWWDQVLGRTQTHAPVLFDDQYLCTGGQFYELMSGRDRMVGDLRPLVLPALGYGGMTMCHPYDVCTGLLLTEAGGILETPDGRPLDAPLDTTTPVAWVGFANETLARQARPALRQACEHYVGATWRNGR